MTESANSLLVEVTRDIGASPDTVWGILTTPALFSAWMDGEAAFEARVGSPFRADFPKFQMALVGEIVTLDADGRHIGLTWGIESGPHAELLPAGSSLVDIQVAPEGTGCRVVVRHSRLPSEQAVEQNRSGWGFHLSRLALQANRADLTAGLERTLAGWFSAWNETDDEARLDTLRACCSPDVEFRDDWTSSSGVENLSLHISNCFRYMPGWKLEATGDVRICRGEALVGWQSIGMGGGAFSGHNHVRAHPDGTIIRVVGFTQEAPKE